VIAWVGSAGSGAMDLVLGFQALFEVGLRGASCVGCRF